MSNETVTKEIILEISLKISDFPFISCFTYNNNKDISLFVTNVSYKYSKVTSIFIVLRKIGPFHLKIKNIYVLFYKFLITIIVFLITYLVIVVKILRNLIRPV